MYNICVYCIYSINVYKGNRNVTDSSDMEDAYDISYFNKDKLFLEIKHEFSKKNSSYVVFIYIRINNAIQA